MSKIKRKLQFAARRGIFIFRRDDGKYDVIDQAGPCDFEMSKREAVNWAYHAACRPMWLKVYISEANGFIHRATCDKVSYQKPGKKCKCHYLQQNQS